VPGESTRLSSQDSSDCVTPDNLDGTIAASQGQKYLRGEGRFSGGTSRNCTSPRRPDAYRPFRRAQPPRRVIDAHLRISEKDPSPFSSCLHRSAPSPNSSRVAHSGRPPRRRPRPRLQIPLSPSSSPPDLPTRPQQTGRRAPIRRRYKIPGYGVITRDPQDHPNAGEELVSSPRAAGIDPTTVAFSRSPRHSTPCSSKFEYDIVSPDKLPGKYLGKSVIINRKQEVRPGERMLPETTKPALRLHARATRARDHTSSSRCQMIPAHTRHHRDKLFELRPA